MRFIAISGHALETMVLLDSLREGAEVGCLSRSDGSEGDFHARFPDG